MALSISVQTSYIFTVYEDGIHLVLPIKPTNTYLVIVCEVVDVWLGIDLL